MTNWTCHCIKGHTSDYESDSDPGSDKKCPTCGRTPLTCAVAPPDDDKAEAEAQS